MIALQSVSKSFGVVRALHDVSLQIGRNEVVGLIGENGAGKSTLMRILCGGIRADRGTMLIDGAPVVLGGIQDANRHGIAMMFQEQSLLLNMSVADNLHLAQEARFRRAGLLSRRRMYAAARALLAKVGLDIDPGQNTGALSFAMRQMVELAKTLALEERTDKPLTVLLDEPTSVLEARDIAILFERMRALKSRASFVFVSHRLEEVLEISDRVYVMKDGEVVAERTAGQSSVPDLHARMVGRDLHSEYYREARQAPPLPDVALEARGLSLRGVYSGLDFTLHRGEVLGIAGVIGSGREELTRTLFGFLPHTGGTLRVAGAQTVLRSPAQAVSAGIGYVPRERRVEGLVMDLTVAANITLAHLSAAMRGGLIDHRRENAIADDWIGRLHIRTPSSAQLCRNLSGGNQQKTVLARWMTAGVRILILDHPTRGLDVGAKEEVYDLIRDLCAQGIAIVLTSDTLEETIGLCHTILVMRDGVITARFDAAARSKPPQVALVEHMV
jgi:ribose transport system ATP-binding protein